MATIYVDGVPYEVQDGQSLLQACLSLGFNIPYFCWHPALGSVGACRQCAIKEFKDERDTRGRIVMACMTPVADGQRISIDDPEVRVFRASVIEWLMVNHPHDCPVCDEGGECHLQDMTVMTGHSYREHRFRKRTYRNQDMGPFLNHEMNRCIQCYRCVRFYRGYAGGRDLHVLGAHDHVYFGRHREGILENEFSGNLVEVCPTGVFTDKTFKRHYSRSWDLQTAPSVCVHCAVGCNTIAGERTGELRRIRNRYNREVNSYFLCDRGRYGYEFVNSDRRIRKPLVRSAEGGGLAPAGREEALSRVATLLSRKGRAVGIGSPRASLEANFALRELVGPDRFCLGLSAPDAKLLTEAVGILVRGPARSPSVHNMQGADVAFIVGEDVTNTAPLIALALRQRVPAQAARRAEQMHIPRWNDAAYRQVIQDERAGLYLATPTATKLEEVATQTYHAAPEEVARLGFAVASRLSAAAPKADDLSEEVRSLADEIARALKGADRPLIVSGTGCHSASVLEAAANVAWALCETGRPAELCLVVPEWNSLGLAMLGGCEIEDGLRLLKEDAADTLIILENDLDRKLDAAAVEDLLAAARHVVVIDHLESVTSHRAEVVLPAATFAEAAGTVVSYEGRAQRSCQVFVPEGDIQASWHWLRDLMNAAGRPEARSWRNLDAVDEALVKSVPLFGGILEISPPAEFRMMGRRIPRQPHRYSGRTALRAQVSVYEPKPPEDQDSALAFSMEGYEGQPPPALTSRYWAPGWNSVQALNKFQSEVGGPLRGGDPGRRLIEPTAEGATTFFTGAPAHFVPREGEFLLIPLFHIFGSEELSALSQAIAQRTPKPYVAVHPQEAADQGLEHGAEVRLEVQGISWRLPLLLMPALARGVAGVPVGLKGLTGLSLPAWGRIIMGPEP
jgi:NADH-quinone oxidoreductase subunit G